MRCETSPLARLRYGAAALIATFALGGIAAQWAAADPAPLESLSTSSLPANYAAGDSWDINGSACGSQICVSVGAYEFAGATSGNSHGLIVPIKAGIAGAGAQVSLPSNAITGASQDDGLEGVSCSSTDTCVAVGYYTDSNGNEQALVVPMTGGVPGAAEEVALPSNQDEGYLDAVSCSASGGCVAVGAYQDTSGAVDPLVVDINNGVAATGTGVVPPANADTSQYSELDGVSCQSSSACVAVGYYYNDGSGSSDDYSALVVPINNGAPATAQTGALPTNATGVQDAWFPYIACPSAGACDAVGYYEDTSGNTDNLIVPITNGTQGQPAVPALPANAAANGGSIDLNGLSCQSSGSCLAVGYYDDTSSNEDAAVIPIKEGVPSSAVQVTLPSDANTTGTADSQYAALDSVSCPASGACMAAGYYVNTSGYYTGMTVSFDAGTVANAVEPQQPADVSTTNPGLGYDAVACAASSCALTGDYENTAGNDVPFVLSAQAQLAVSTTSLPGGAIGSSYSKTLAATGAWSAYSWSVTSGKLPAGLSLNSATGVISGKPTKSGSSTFTVQATGTGAPAQTVKQSLSLTVAKAALKVVGSSATVKKNRFGLRLRCSGGSCNGTAKLQVSETYTVKHGKKQVRKHRTVVLGSLHFSLSKGKTRTYTAALNAAGRKLLAADHHLKATVLATVDGVKETAGHLTLKAAAVKKKK